MSNLLSYAESVAYLEDLWTKPIRPRAELGLGRITYLLDRLDNPQRSFRSVHVAGSSGKGSTTAMIGEILQRAGFKTGRFHSPHLVSYTERILVDGVPIGEDDWARMASLVVPIVEGMREPRPDHDFGRPSIFEVIFAMMALWFAESGVEWAAIETGMGGRFDATNVLQSDVAVVTNISLEHTQVLGTTVAAIAAEKAAIIKRGAHAVTAAQDAEALRVIEARAADVDAPLLRVGKDIHVQVESQDLRGQRVSFSWNGGSLEISLSLAGQFQQFNAGAALGAALSLQERGVALSGQTIVAGLEAAQVPGRFEVVSLHPIIILDGAHHPAAIDQLADSLRQLVPGRPLTLVFAAMADKDIRRMAGSIGPLANAVFLTRAPGTHRAASPEAMVEFFDKRAAKIMVEEDAERAIEQARSEMNPGGVLVITGSLYLVGYARRLLLGSMRTR